VSDLILDADVAAALEAVTPMFRTVVLLNDVAGVPRDEIAHSSTSSRRRSAPVSSAGETTEGLRVTNTLGVH